MEEKNYGAFDSNKNRIYKDIVLDCKDKGKAHFTISKPKHIPLEGLPCVFIVGGLITGRESLRFIPDHGEYILVAYEYPKQLKGLFETNAIRNLCSLRKNVLKIPGQLLAISEFLKNQSYVNQEPIHMMGYSFGATFVPVTYIIAQQKKFPLGLGVMAYGGANLYCLFKANLPLPRFLKGLIAKVGAAIFKPIDPILYAPKMKGDFLFVNGVFDRKVPLECAKQLQNLVSEPKTIINLETIHMHPDNMDINLQLIQISRSWIEKKRLKKE